MSSVAFVSTLCMGSVGHAVHDMFVAALLLPLTGA
jgi:hypothetical protein